MGPWGSRISWVRPPPQHRFRPRVSLLWRYLGPRQSEELTQLLDAIDATGTGAYMRTGEWGLSSGLHYCMYLPCILLGLQGRPGGSRGRDFLRGCGGVVPGRARNVMGATGRRCHVLRPREAQAPDVCGWAALRHCAPESDFRPVRDTALYL